VKNSWSPWKGRGGQRLFQTGENRAFKGRKETGLNCNAIQRKQPATKKGILLLSEGLTQERKNKGKVKNRRFNMVA